MPNLHVFIGTKAQYIKTAPLMRLMQERGIDYNLIDSGQHAAFAPELRRELGVKEPDVVLREGGNIKSVTEAARWMSGQLLQVALRKRRLVDEVFRGRQGICIVHGDTPSTLVATLAAKRAGLEVALIEAGLRSYNLLRPFPEELVRVVAMRLSDYLFAPSQWAYDNMVDMGLSGQLVLLDQNTNVEAVWHALDGGSEGPDEPYCLMTIHRVETLLYRRRLEHVVRLAEAIAERMPVRFVLHDPTREKLASFGLLPRIEEHPDIETSGLVPHAEFVRLLAHAEFVVTDGGSIQEESFYLDVPCLVVRSETERQEGLGTNVVLSAFDWEQSLQFVEGYAQHRTGGRVDDVRPSEVILDTLLGDG